MSVQERSAETKSLPSEKKAFNLSNQFVFPEILLFILGLVVSYAFMENSVISILMDYLTRSQENLRRAAIITNLQDGLSCISVVIVSLISEAYTGRFTMITFCSSASIMVLMLLWISATSNSDYAMVYVAISLITLGRAGGRKVLQDFSDYQLDEKARANKGRKPQHENTDNIEKQGQSLSVILWQLAVWFFGYATTVVLSVGFTHPWKYFRFAALLMGGTYLLFYFGYAWYSHENLPAESNLGKIYRIFRAAYRKRKFRYPTSENEYHRKTNTQHYFYEAKQALRLLPQVPLLGWLDKAAIVKGQETEVELCTVKEVREVKSVVLLIFWGFTFFANSLVVASGNTFFVGQASNLRPAYSGNDIPLLFVLKSTLRDVLLLFGKHIGAAVKIMRKVKVTKDWVVSNFGFKRRDATIIRIGAGMFCSLICCFVAYQVEVRRLYLIKKEGILKNISMRTRALVPQILLLGISEGLAEGGLKDLFHRYASKSMRTFDESFSQLVIGVGKLLTIPYVLIFRSWIKESANASHLERYFLMLAGLNSMFLLGFLCYTFNYAHKEEYTEDEEIVMEQRSISKHAHQTDLEEANAKAENMAIREGPMVATGDSHPETNIEIVPA